MAVGSFVIPMQSSAGGGNTAQTAMLLKTGQTTAYATSDDGDLQEGRSGNITTLPHNNPYGNTTRFLDETGGATFTNGIIIDWSTWDQVTGKVLGYNKNRIASAVWATAVANCASVSIGSFTSGWRIANIRELLNIVRHTQYPGYWMDYAPFNIPTANYYSGSTQPYFPTQAFGVWASYSPVYYFDKSTSCFSIAVRTFTVTGTTLT